MNFSALDIETSSTSPEHPEYALQPWRPEFRVDLVILGNLITASPERLVAAIKYYDLDLKLSTTFVYTTLQDKKDWCLEDGYVWTWNGIFDIAGLMSQGIDCSKVKWLDAMSAAKWILRSQATDPPIENGKRYSFSLANVAKDYLKDWQHYDEFMEVKDEIKDDPEYWRRRCELDVEATLRLGMLFWNQMTQQQKRSFLIEQAALYPTAKAWIEGCHYDFVAAQELEETLMAEKMRLTEEIGRYIDEHNTSLEN
jgi:hypothetical protein